MNKNISLNISKEPLSKLHFVKKESFLSQMYHSLENYWDLLTLLDYKFITKKNKKGETYYIIFEPESEYEKISLISNQRRERLVAQRAYISMSDDSINKLIKNKDYTFLKKSKSFQVTSLSNNEHLLSSYISLLSQEVFLTDFFPKKYLEDSNEKGFNVLDILKIFKQLSLLAIQYSNDFKNEEIEENEPEKLLEFCPKIKKNKLIKSLTSITKYKFTKVEKMLDFLEYKGDKNDDLWTNPIFSLNKNEYILLTSAIDSPNLLRTVERLVVKLGINIDKKGEYYEDLIVQDFNEVLTENDEIKNFEPAVSRKIKLNDKSEQIDFLCKIGDKILLGETKCIITSDSPRREYNTYKRLEEEASFQVERKKNFIQQDLEETFKVLNWEFNPISKYEIIGFIINSNRTLVGLSINEIPIIDKEILLNYFKSNKFPILTTVINDEVKHIAYFILYNTIIEMEKNIITYLKNPPPIILHKHSFKRELIKTPILNEKSNRFLLSKLVPIKLEPKKVFEKQYPFEIEKIKNFDEYIKDEIFFI